MQVVEVTQALEALSQRGFGIIIDDTSARSKAVLFAPARELSAAILNEMLNICASQVMVTINAARKQSLQLGPMRRHGAISRTAEVSSYQRAELPLCESVEAREGIHTGISVADRATTIRILAHEDPNPRRLVKPGHIFPIEIASGGVLVKSAVFEAAADAATLTQGHEVAAVIDLLGASGDYMSADEIAEVAKKYALPILRLGSLVVYRLRTERLVEEIAQAAMPVRSGTQFTVHSYRSTLDGIEHIALSLGDNFDSGPVLTRVHSEKLLSDIFDPQSGAGSSMLGRSISEIEKEGRGLIVYLRSSARGSFLDENKPPARDALFREYGVGAQIIQHTGAKQLILLSSSSVIPAGLENFGLEITGVRQI